jgi:maltose/moltooligosaccharide transporter
MWIYTTNGIAENVYQTTDAQSALFQEAANWVGIMFAVYNGVSALGAFVLPVFARATSRKTVHAVCLAIGGISLVSLFFITTKQALLVPMVGVGLAWASILSMPYAILAGSLPARRMGYFMGLFNFFVVIPQICSGTLLGFANKYLFDGHPIRILVLGGVCMLVAAALTLFVTDKTERLADR